MGRRIVVIQGHPDAGGGHFGHRLADAYREAAEAGGHEVRLIDVAALEVPLLRSKAEWEAGQPTPDLQRAQESLAWAQHWVIFYPLWLGNMPAMLKAFLEQVLRPGFAVERGTKPLQWHRRLRGRSARVVVTMGMPARVYRWIYRAHSLKSLEHDILKFCGIGPISNSLVGMVEAGSDKRRRRWLERMARLGDHGI